MPGLSFSVVGFGCWATGGADIWNGSTDDDSVATIRAALELGITFFDVAPVYGYGHAEEVLGRALRGHRDEVILASKCGLRWEPGETATRNDLSPASIRWEIEGSLRRLGTDHIDLYQMHWPDPATPVEESMATLVDLQRQGKIRHIGVSNFSAALTERAAAVAPVASYQGLYNMLEHNPTSYHNIPLEYRTRREILPLVEREGMAFLPYSPLFQGLLTDAFKRDGNFDEHDARAANPKLGGEAFAAYFEIAQELREVAVQSGHPLSQLAINWLVAQDAVTSVIAGGQRPAQVVENAGAATWTLTHDVAQRVEEILAPHVADGLV